MKKLSALLAAAVCAICLVPQASATSLCNTTAGNIVANCGFETGSFSGWSVSGNQQGGVNGLYIGVDSSNPNSGSYGAYFGAQSSYAQGTGTNRYGPATTISQTLSVLPGEAYKITFSLDNNGCSTLDPGCAGYYNHFDAYFNGAQVYSANNLTYTGAYVPQTFFINTNATGNSGLLQFDLTNDSDYFYFDDVSVLAVGASTPEPSSLVLLGTGILSAAGTVVRRRVRPA